MGKLGLWIVYKAVGPNELDQGKGCGHPLLEVRLGRRNQPRSMNRKAQGEWRIIRRKGWRRKVKEFFNN